MRLSYLIHPGLIRSRYVLSGGVFHCIVDVGVVEKLGLTRSRYVLSGGVLCCDVDVGSGRTVGANKV